MLTQVEITANPTVKDSVLEVKVKLLNRIRTSTIPLSLLVALLVVFCANSPCVAAQLSTLASVKKNGVLRILKTEMPDMESLPRRVSPEQYENILLLSLAEHLNVKLKFVYIPRFEDLIPALLAGKGDMIAANMTITKDRLKRINFSVPITSTVEQIVTRANHPTIRNVGDLSGKTIIIEKGTSYWQSVKELSKRVPGLKLKAAPDGVDTEELLYRVANGEDQLTVADSNYIEAFQSYNPEIETIHTFPKKRYIAWGLQPKASELHKAINNFLKKELPNYTEKSVKGDLPQIRRRKMLRVLTCNNPLDYFLHKGQLMGFEYELVKKFAKEQGVKLVMVVPPSWDDLIPWLLQGKGDLIAASMTITPSRQAIKGLTFCRPYGEIREMLVARKDDPVTKRKDLEGRTIAVRKGSSYWDTLEKLKGRYDFKMQVVPAELEEYQIIEKVAAGEYDLTVADDQIIKAELLRRSDVRAVFALSEPGHYGWAVRAEDQQLKQAIDRYFDTVYRSTFYNMLKKRYFTYSRKVSKHINEFENQDRLCRFDPVIKKFADKYRFHWCLVASQIYQESRFDPDARSWIGAVGLMQIMPATAADVGFKRNLAQPETNIHAGVKYMSTLRNRFKPPLADEDKVCFALACYNGGYGHIIDARRLARELRYNPDVWFGHVEKAMALLANRKYSSRARYGFCKGDEIAVYVRDIYNRFKMYKRLVESPGSARSRN